MDIGIVGLGGIGTHLVRILRQLDPSFYLFGIDGDRVEEGNLARQGFSADDVGDFKVDALDLDNSMPEFLEENEEQWRESLGGPRGFDVLFSAVDNMKGRRTVLHLASFLEKESGAYPMVIICGNERDDAEALVWKPGITPLHPYILAPDMETKQDERDPTHSCQRIVTTVPQTALANETAAILGVQLMRTWSRTAPLKQQLSSEEFARYLARLPQRIVWQKGVFLHYPEAKKGGFHVPSEE